MRHGRRARWLLLAVGFLGLAGCGTGAGGMRVEGPAPTAIRWTGPVYLDDARSMPRQHPDVMDLTNVTTLYGMKWRGWGTPRAVATGLVVDFSCQSLCPQGKYNPPYYPVRLVLSGLVKREYAAYYSSAVLSPDPPPAPHWALDVGELRLRVPAA